MTERPIILHADEVRAVLAGTQTQVRRPVDARHVQYLGGAPQTSDPADWGYWVDDEYGRWAVLARGVRERMHNGHVSIRCPIGQPGDRLWVRETWAALEPAASEETAREHMDRVLSGPDGLTLALLEALEGLADIEDKSFADNCYCACCGEHPAHGQPFGGHADNCALVAARLAIAKARGTDGHVRQRREP